MDTEALISTAGQIFSDGSMLELIADTNGDAWQLMLLTGQHEITGRTIEHAGRRYTPIAVTPDLQRELILPSCCRPYGTTRELLSDISRAVTNFVGLREKPASLIARLVNSSWVLEGLQIAPALVISGTDAARAERLLALLKCICRHAIYLSSVTPSSLCSLPDALALTFLIQQPSISAKLAHLLCAVRHRDAKIPHRGRLLNLFGAQAILSSSISGPHSCSLDLSMIPGGAPLPPFDTEIRRRLASELQPRLLSFRRANLAAAEKLRFDACGFDPSMRDIACCFAAATPDDEQLSSELDDLLRDEDDLARDKHWVEFDAVAAEALLVKYRNCPGSRVHVGDLAKTAQEILRCRGAGEDVTVDPGAYGKWLHDNGLPTERRDERGVPFRLTEDVFRRAEELARYYGAPAAHSATNASASRRRRL